MSRPADPTRPVVLSWMVEHDRGAADAVTHFWPQLTDGERRTQCQRVRTWAKRQRQRAGKADAAADKAASMAALVPRRQQRAPPPPPPPPSPEEMQEPQRPTADHVAKMGTLERLEWQLSRVAASLDMAFQAGDVRGVAAASKALTDVGKDLDRARREQSKMGGMAEGVEGLTTKANALRDIIRRTEAHMAAQKAAQGRQL